jgi:hypothetical protein
MPRVGLLHHFRGEHTHGVDAAHLDLGERIGELGLLYGRVRALRDRIVAERVTPLPRRIARALARAAVDAALLTAAGGRRRRNQIAGSPPRGRGDMLLLAAAGGRRRHLHVRRDTRNVNTSCEGS